MLCVPVVQARVVQLVFASVFVEARSGPSWPRGTGMQKVPFLVLSIYVGSFAKNQIRCPVFLQFVC